MISLEEPSHTRGQFYQHSTRSFYVCKLLTQLFCAYVLGLNFTGVSLPEQKLRVEHWWNWTQECGQTQTYRHWSKKTMKEYFCQAILVVFHNIDKLLISMKTVSYQNGNLNSNNYLNMSFSIISKYCVWVLWLIHKHFFNML